MARSTPKRLVGYRRVASSGACYFCLMLVSRGTVYRSRETADFRAHSVDGKGRGGNCSCTAEPVWDRTPDPPETVALREEFQAVTRGETGARDKLRVWRAHVRAGRPGPITDPLRLERLARARAADPRFAVGARTGQGAIRAARVGRRLTAAEAAAVDRYAGDASFNINAALREGRGSLDRLRRESHRAVVEGLDSALEPLSSDVVVYRRLAAEHLFDPSSLSGDLTGQPFDDFAFVSTSIGRRDVSSSLVMRIRVPEGTPAISGHGLDTDEIVLGRGLRYRVVADHGSPGGTVRLIDVEVVPRT